MSKRPDRSCFVIPVESNPFKPGRRYFVAEDGRVTEVSVICDADYAAWLRRIPGPSGRVDRTVIVEEPEVFVATSFVGFDFEPPGSEPRVWGTMIWGGPLHQQTWNYATYGEAKVGHWKAVDLARQAMKQQPAT